MSLPTLCLLAVLCPQKEGKLVLPAPQPRPAQAPEEPAAEQLSEQERFEREVFRLRRSARLSPASAELVLKEMGGFAQPSAMAMRLARTENADVLFGLLQVVRRFGDATDAKELNYLLLTRPFRGATRLGVTVMTELSADPKAALTECLTARYTSVRKAATDELLARIDRSDLDAIVELSRDPQGDVRRKAMFLLGALPYEPARDRLLEELGATDPALASTACLSLIGHGVELAAEPLGEIVRHAAVDRSFGYAAFALSQLEDQTGQVLFTEEMVPHLRSELTGHDLFMRVTAALALANVAFRSTDAHGVDHGDREIVDGLLLVVSPRDFVPNISMLQRPAARKLAQFTGQEFSGRNAAWRAWWDRTRPGFVGTRLALEITPENGDRAVLAWSDERLTRRFAGPEAPPPEVADDVEGRPDTEGQAVEDYLLSGPEMDALVQRLRQQGFMTQGLLASAAAADMMPVVRSLDLRLGGGRCLVRGPAAPARWLDVLGAEIATVAERERWQLYRDPLAEPDRLAFWQAERAWLAAHPDRAERDARLLDRILAAYSTLSPAQRDRALVHIEAIPELRDVLTAEHAGILTDLAAAAGAIDNRSFRLLELALLAPGDAWRSVLDIIDSLHDVGGENALPRVFSLLGPDKVLAAIDDGRPRVRAAAILETAKLRDVRATPRLLTFLEEPQREVRESAIYALGVLRAAEARVPLIELQADVDTEPATRRVAWVALGRIGGDRVLPILQSAAAAVDMRDQQKAIQGLGELEEPGAAQFLAQIFVAHGQNPLGVQAMASLQKMGSLLARPALRRHLGVRDPRVRREIVMLLAEFVDPVVVPDLMAMIEEHPERTRIVLLLSGITGLDLVASNDRIGGLRRWWSANRSRSQGEWFLDGLARSNVETALRPSQLSPGAGLDAVDELSRLMVESEAPHLRVLAAALLRDVTERDFGLVSMQTPPAQLRAVADRYRFFADAERAAQRR